MSPGTLDRPPDEALTVSTPNAGYGYEPGPKQDGERRQFLPGTRFGKRYRIVELLGRGGMGEVYRADDLQLGHPVALKFLPAHLLADETALARLRNEVRVARQISHPHVCRVYDIDEVDGNYFLSMEFVDGEDLDSVLRRLGRPTEEKALEIARQLCLGVAAAHERGALHRDLKPANVMIDGRGRVRITDFGVASFARELRGAALRGGTPAYMAPELLAGQGSSARSDLFSLGLVLYELFTGHPAFEAASLAELRRRYAEADGPIAPSKLVPGLGADVEQTILGCLALQPEERPVSALAVAAVFPGSDPLTAVRDAGETPSPDLVAEAGPEGALRPVWGVACLATIVIGVFLCGLLARDTMLYGRAPLDKPAVVLQERARQVLRDVGLTETPAGSAGWHNVHWPAVQYFARQDDSGARWDPLSRPGEIGINFLYRQSPTLMVPQGLAGRINFEQPYPDSGNVNLSLGLDGRLLRLEAIPELADHSVGPASEEADWSALFQAAGLNIADFEPVQSRIRPRTHSDSQAAWRGVLPHRGDLPVRVEAMSLNGRPVFFETVTPYDPYWSKETEQAMRPTPARVATVVASLSMLLGILAGAAVLAAANFRQGRGDRKGALRLALFVLVLRLAEWLAAGHHVPSLGGEFNLFVQALGGGLVLALLTWTFYMAAEPYFRRLRPEALVSWTRLLTGRVRDPLVARDVLIGLSLGVLLVLVQHITLAAPNWFGITPSPPATWGTGTLDGGSATWAALFQGTLYGLAEGLGYAFLILASRILLRRAWISVLALCVVFGAFGALDFAADPAGPAVLARIPFGVLLGVAMALLLVTLLLRLGLLAVVACTVAMCLMVELPIAVDPSAPYFGATLLLVATILGLAVYAFRRSQSRRLPAY